MFDNELDAFAIGERRAEAGVVGEIVKRSARQMSRRGSRPMRGGQDNPSNY